MSAPSILGIGCGGKPSVAVFVTVLGSPVVACRKIRTPTGDS
jgi:hypothetical protein